MSRGSCRTASVCASNVSKLPRQLRRKLRAALNTVGELNSSSRPSAPMERERPSSPARSSRWHVTHATCRLPDKLASWNNLSPRSSLALEGGGADASAATGSCPEGSAAPAAKRNATMTATSATAPSPLARLERQATALGNCGSRWCGCSVFDRKPDSRRMFPHTKPSRPRRRSNRDSRAPGLSACRANIFSWSTTTPSCAV